MSVNLGEMQNGRIVRNRIFYLAAEKSQHLFHYAVQAYAQYHRLYVIYINSDNLLLPSPLLVAAIV